MLTACRLLVLQRSTVLAGDGADTLQIGSMSKGSVEAGPGNDSIVVAGGGLLLPARCVQALVMT